MILVKPSFEIKSMMGGDFPDDSPLEIIEKAGRTCYKSEGLTTENSAENFVKMITKRGHESVIEHSALTIKFVIDRGVSHELVRHRLCAFSQESTRYCNYKGGVTFVIPLWLKDLGEGKYHSSFKPTETLSNATWLWLRSMLAAERCYTELFGLGWSPQQARSVLPNSTKTEIVVTANLREWRHIFKLRCSKAAHPQMREIMIPLLERCKELIPIIFDDINIAGE